MTIDPRVGFWFSVVMAIVSALGICGTQLTTLFGDVMANKVLAAIVVLNVVNSAINAILHAIPAKPGAASEFALGPKLVIILAVLIGGLLAFPGNASAQTGNIVKDIATARAARTVTPKAAVSAPASTTAPVNSIDALMAKLDKIASDIVAGVVGDINAADLDAGQLLNPADPTSFKDPIAHACYPAEVKFLQALPTATPTTGNYVVVQLFQKKRDFVNQLKAGLPDYLKIGCGALLGDETQIFISTMAMVGVTVATGGISGLLPAAAMLPALPALAL